MADETPIDSGTVRELATAAQLPLAPDRATQLAPQLRTWLRAANELNAKMNDPAYRIVAPATIFTHATVEGATE